MINTGSILRGGAENNNRGSNTSISTSLAESSSSMTSTQRSSDVELRTNAADGECASGSTTSTNEERRIAVQNKGGSKIINKDNMAEEHDNITRNKESCNVVKQIGNDVNNSWSKISDCRTKETSSAEMSSNKRATNNSKDAFASVLHENTKVINNSESNTSIVKDNNSVSVGAGAQSVQLTDCTNRQNISLGITTIRGNDISCPQNIGDTLSDTEHTKSTNNKSKNNSADNNCKAINLNRVGDQHCEDQQMEHDDIPRSLQNNVSNVNHEQRKYQGSYIPDLSDFDLNDQASKKEVCGAINKRDAFRMVEDMTEIPGMISNNQTNSPVNPTRMSVQKDATGNTIEDFSKKGPKASDGVSNGREAGNIRYGKTPTNQKTSE